MTIVLLHDSAGSASNWKPVADRLEASGHDVLRPDLIGYGGSKQPSCCYKVAKEVQHLKRCIEERRAGPLHLVGHGYGAFVALHLRHALRPRVKSLTLVAPLVAGILRECGEMEALAEMDQLYRRFMSLSTHNESAAGFFVDHRQGQGSWAAMDAGSRGQISSLIPKVRREMVALHADKSQLAWLVGAWMPAAVLIGEESCRPVRAAGWRLAKAFGTDAISLEGTSHLIPSTHPDAVAEIVSRLAVIQTSRRAAG